MPMFQFEAFISSFQWNADIFISSQQTPSVCTGRQKAIITQINPLRYYMIKSCNLIFNISLLYWKKGLKKTTKRCKKKKGPSPLWKCLSVCIDCRFVPACVLPGLTSTEPLLLLVCPLLSVTVRVKLYFPSTRFPRNSTAWWSELFRTSYRRNKNKAVTKCS